MLREYWNSALLEARLLVTPQQENILLFIFALLVVIYLIRISKDKRVSRWVQPTHLKASEDLQKDEVKVKIKIKCL